MKKIIIQDDYGKNYVIEDLIEFKNHIKNFFSINGEGDNSLHEENGRFFTITREFFRHIKHL